MAHKDNGRIAITVAELIVELQALPQDAIVLAEGCDCYGEAKGAEYQPDGGWGEPHVLITRR